MPSCLGSSVCSNEDSRNEKTPESGKQGSSKKLKKSMCKA